MAECDRCDRVTRAEKEGPMTMTSIAHLSALASPGNLLATCQAPLRQEPLLDFHHSGSDASKLRLMFIKKE
jgi:hypothetical protein